MKNTRHLTALVLLSTLIGAGCASTAPVEPSTSGRTISDITVQYKQGNDMVAEGERVKQEADAQIAAASARKAEGQSLVTRGQTLMAESEQAFRDKAGKGEAR